MIRSTPTGAQFSYRRRLGSAAAAVGAFNPLAAGIGAGVALASTAITDWMQSIQVRNMGKSGATAVANEMATQLTNLRNAYLAEQNPTCADQRAALDAFDAALVWFQSPAGCGNPQFGSAGDRCIAERAYPGAIYSYVDAIRNPIANDPRLASAGCDTGEAVFLPSTQGGYSATGITSTGGSSTTGQTAAQIAAGAVAATALPTTAASSPNLILIAAVAAGALLLAKAL